MKYIKYKISNSVDKKWGKFYRSEIEFSEIEFDVEDFIFHKYQNLIDSINVFYDTKVFFLLKS